MTDHKPNNRPPAFPPELLNPPWPRGVLTASEFANHVADRSREKIEALSRRSLLPAKRNWPIWNCFTAFISTSRNPSA